MAAQLHPAPYRHVRRGRSWTALGLIAAYYAGLVLLRIQFGAADWILILLALPALPALWDFVSNPVWELQLDDTALSWQGPRSDRVEFREIDHIRLDTRWDLSVRATIFLAGGRKVRLPDPALPPHRRFEAELNARALRTERHHFRIF